MSDVITVDSRFCGPPGFGNGGYVSGVIADALGAVCEISLMAPTPLQTAMQIVRLGEGGELRDGETVIARAAVRPLDLDTPAPVSLADARAAAKHYPGFKAHAFPRCFVCGPDRAEGEGLRIFVGAVEGREVMAGTWTPSQDLADAAGEVRTPFIHAALDCPGYFAVQPDAGPCVLGRFHVETLGALKAGEEAVLTAWPMERSGRRFGAGSALYDARGALVARARAVWVRIADASKFKVSAA